MRRKENITVKKVLVAMPVLLLGGTEIQVLSMVRALKSGNYRIIVCCYYEYDTEVVRRFEDAGVKVLLLKLDRSDGKFGFFRIRELLKSLKGVFAEQHPEVVHVQYLAPGLVPIVAAKMAGVPTVVSTVHIAGKCAYGWKARLLLRFASRFCNAFICVSRGVEEFWFGSSKLFVPHAYKKRRHFTIYNAVDVARIAECANMVDRERIKVSLCIQDGPVIGTVGRLAEQKGHSVLLDAMVALFKQIPNAVLLVVGDGPERVALQSKAMSLGIDQNIRWLGGLPQEDVFALYGIMDLFVMPSLYEGFGLTAAEAMAAGVPVIGTKVAGLSEIIIDGQSGVLLPPGNITALAGALTDLLSDGSKAKEMGQNGRQRVERIFSMKQFERSILAAYGELSAR